MSDKDKMLITFEIVRSRYNKDEKNEDIVDGPRSYSIRFIIGSIKLPRFVCDSSWYWATDKELDELDKEIRHALKKNNWSKIQKAAKQHAIPGFEDTGEVSDKLGQGNRGTVPRRRQKR